MARWPAVTQVACKSIADARLERAHLKTHALGALDPQTIVLPVDIVELQAPDLSRAQPIDREQQQNGAIAETGGIIPQGRVNHTADLVPGRPKGEAFMPIEVGQEDRVGEARGVQPCAAQNRNQARRPVATFRSVIRLNRWAMCW